MVGLLVTPTTNQLAMWSARVPDSSRFLDKSSSQIATPAAESRRRFSVILLPPPCYSAVGCGAPVGSAWAAAGHLGQAVPGGPHHVFSSNTELLVEDPVRGGGAVVIQADDLARVADQPVPGHRHRRLDRDPGPDRRRQYLVSVGLLLRVEPLQARHRDHPG